MADYPLEPHLSPMRSPYGAPKFPTFHKFPHGEALDFSPNGSPYMMKRPGPPGAFMSAGPMQPLGGPGTPTLPPSALPGGLGGPGAVSGLGGAATSSSALAASVASSAAAAAAVAASDGEPVPGGWSGLDMSRMGLRNLSLRLGIFQHLKVLNLGSNQLSVFPGVLCTKLTCLTVLDLSNNVLTRIPSEIGWLVSLKTLMLYNNQITELPLEMGKLFKLTTLNVEVNPIVKPSPAIIHQGTQKIIAFLRDRMEPPPPPPDRKWISYVDNESYKGAHHANRPKIRVMAYNILADSYATPDRYAYCPAWALLWSYRKEKILKELAESQADLICLQEMETGEYTDFFADAMLKLGYQGIFKPKSRAYMSGVNTHKVDGCAIFYRAARFTLVQESVIEFQRLALARHSKLSSEESQSGHDRLYQRDNIALVAIFELNDDKVSSPSSSASSPSSSSSSSPSSSSAPSTSSSSSSRGQRSAKTSAAPHKIIVCNTHVHWNPELADVKLMQTQMMMEELVSIRNALKAESPTAKLAPMIVCGDFNSEPTSGVYELLSQGEVMPDHPDFGEYRYGVYSQQGLKHNIPLVSTYNPQGLGEPPFTNYTANYVGVLDYIFVTKDTLRPCGIAEHVSKQTIISQGFALPSPHFPSDHLSLISEIEIQ